MTGLPGYSSSLPNERTRQLRPPVRLTVEQATRARDLKKMVPELTVEEIAVRIGGDPEATRLALAVLRTPSPSRRHVLNVSGSAYALVRREALSGEPVHAALDRLLGFRS
jgi:hypothetical protein